MYNFQTVSIPWHPSFRKQVLVCNFKSQSNKCNISLCRDGPRAQHSDFFLKAKMSKLSIMDFRGSETSNLHVTWIGLYVNQYSATHISHQVSPEDASSVPRDGGSSGVRWSLPRLPPLLLLSPTPPAASPHLPLGANLLVISHTACRQPVDLQRHHTRSSRSTNVGS